MDCESYKEGERTNKIREYGSVYAKESSQKDSITIYNIMEKGEKLLQASEKEKYGLFNNLLQDLENINNEILDLYYHSKQFKAIFDVVTSELINAESFECGANFIRMFNSCNDYKLFIENIKDNIECFIIKNASKEAYDFYIMELCATSIMPSINFFNKTMALHDIGSFTHTKFVYFLYKNGYEISKETLYQVIKFSQGCELLIYEIIHEATKNNYIEIERINVKVFIRAFYQFWRDSDIKIHMCTWIAYCKKVHLNKSSVEIIRKLVNDILNGTISAYNARQKKFIINFFQGVSYIDKELLVSQKDIQRMIRVYNCVPTSRLIYIITALRSKVKNYRELNEETQKFIDDVYRCYEESEYSEYDNGNESGAFNSEEDSDDN